MTVEASIFGVLGPLVSGRCFPDFAPISTVRPYITYVQIGGEALSFLDGTLPDKKHGRFQVNVWADTRASASSIMLQVESAMAASTAFQCTAVSASISDYDHDMSVYGAMQDFSVLSSR